MIKLILPPRQACSFSKNALLGIFLTLGSVPVWCQDLT
jgi:hypothetical protein